MDFKKLLVIVTCLLVSISNAHAQSYEWAKRIGGSYVDVGTGITVDPSGNVYVTGYFSGMNIDFDPGPGTALLSSRGQLDVFFAKYDSTGNFIWAKNIGGSLNDVGFRLKVDSSGNIYLAGWFYSTNADFDPGTGTAYLGAEGEYDIFLAKYDDMGNYLWARKIGGTGYDGVHGFLFDHAGHILMAGYFQGSNVDFDPGPDTAALSSNGSFDAFVTKYDNDGNYIWSKNVGGSSVDAANGIAVDDSGNIYLTGEFSGTNADFDPGPDSAYLNSSGAADIFIAKYDWNGNYNWAKNIGGTGGDSGYEMVCDPSANLYITGYFSGTDVDFDPGAGSSLLSSAGGMDVFTASYDADGNFKWANRIGGPNDDLGQSITIDEWDNIYTTGYFQDTNVDFDPGPGSSVLNSQGAMDIYFNKSDKNGNYIFAAGIGGTNSDYGNNIAVDARQHVYITGYIKSVNADFDPGPGTALLNSAGNEDVFFGKYAQSLVDIENMLDQNPPMNIRLNQNYPNPFNPSTEIGYFLSVSCSVNLSIYNVLGQKVQTLINSKQPAGEHRITWDGNNNSGKPTSTGIYFYRLQTEHGIMTKKMLLIR